MLEIVAGVVLEIAVRARKYKYKASRFDVDPSASDAVTVLGGLVGGAPGGGSHAIRSKNRSS